MADGGGAGMAGEKWRRIGEGGEGRRGDHDGEGEAGEVGYGELAERFLMSH